MTLNSTPSLHGRRTEIKIDNAVDEASLFHMASECLRRSGSLREAVDEMVGLASGDVSILAALVTEYFTTVVAAGDVVPAGGASSVKLVPPINSPNALQLAAARSAQQRLAESLMDLLCIDRKPIGDWTIGECQAAAVGKFREAQILKSIGRKFVNVDPRVRVRDAVKVEDLQKIVKEAGTAVAEAFSRRDQ